MVLCLRPVSTNPADLRVSGSTTVGTLEFRCIQEPGALLQHALRVSLLKQTTCGFSSSFANCLRVCTNVGSSNDQGHSLLPGALIHARQVNAASTDAATTQASCENFDFENRKVCCVDVYDSAHRYEVPYDYVILAPGQSVGLRVLVRVVDAATDRYFEFVRVCAAGATTATFGVPGISEENHVYFLKQLRDSRNIRTRLIECFERASSPDLTDEAREKLLHFVVVGGGPTSVEYAAELYDFLVEDVKRWYGDLFDLVRVTLVEASPYLLNTFDRQLSGKASCICVHPSRTCFC